MRDERRHGETAFRTILAVSVVGLTLGVSACGKSQGGGSSSSVIAGTTQGTDHNRETTPTSEPAAPHRFGDYDGDDYAKDKFGDGDHDDGNEGTPDRDGDSDNRSGSYYDGDDEAIRAFGHAAPAPQQRAIAAVVEHYFRAAAVRNGAQACALMYDTLARSIPEDQGRSPTLPYMRGNTCTTVMSKLFAHAHQQLSAYIAAALRVTGIRLVGDLGYAVLGFKGLPGRSIPVEREHDRWKIDALLDSELP